MSERWVSVRITGDMACFTRPENKVERVSYPVMTPSAARGILEAIFWHPQFEWRIREIHVLSPVATFSILRNEVNSKMSPSRKEPYYADEDRSQRNAVCLRNVDYAIFADVELRPGIEENHAKYRDQFRRRVERGQCFHRPSLGCREFAAEFGPCDGAEQPVPWTEDLGLMLWDLAYESGKPPYWPKFFAATVRDGVMKVPSKPIEAVQ
jgi:CRISPR-associated protein Cas5d